MSKAGLVVVGIVALVIAGVAARFIMRGGDTDKTLELAIRNGVCVIATPDADKNVEVGKNSKITWKVHNTCPTDQMVLVGNFRTTQQDPAGVMDCKAGRIESTWPFRNIEMAYRDVYIPTNGIENLVLKETRNNTGAKLTFFFDICIAGKKSDPELVIDP
jgi:hypothetical protein